MKPPDSDSWPFNHFVPGPEPSCARTLVQDGYVCHDGVRVYYEVFGDSPDTLTLTPPWALFSNRGSDSLTPYLARHFRVLLVEGRGNGLSDRPQHPAAYSREAQVGDLIAAMDATGTDRATVLGFGPRCPTAIQMATEYPERVRALFLNTPDLWSVPEFVEPFRAGPLDEYKGRAKFNPHYWKADFRGFVEYWASQILPHPHSTRQIEEIITNGLQTDAETLIAATVGYRMYAKDEALELCRRITCPALVTQNGGDSIVPKTQSTLIAEALGCRLHVWERKGPLVSGRWPVTFLLALREFLEEVRAADAA